MRVRTAWLLVVMAVACGGSRPRGGGPAQDADAAARSLDPAEARMLADGFRDALEAMAEVIRARSGVACRGDAGPPAPPDGGASGARCADCAAMAADLDAVFDRAQPLFDRAAAVRADPESTQVLDDAMRQLGGGVPLLVEEISAGLAPCAGNPDLVRVIERMPVL